MRRRQYWRQFSILFLVLEKMNAFQHMQKAFISLFLLAYFWAEDADYCTNRQTHNAHNHNQPQLNAIAVLWRIHFLLFCCSRHIRISRCCTRFCGGRFGRLCFRLSRLCRWLTRICRRLCGFSAAIMGSSTLSNDGINLLRPIFGSADDLDLVICTGK